MISLISFGVACFLASGNDFAFLREYSFWATAITIAAIAASGYWINDVYDFRIDRINKPDKTIVNALLSVKKVLTAYFITISIIILFSALILATYLEHAEITFVNLLSIFLLFIYASYLKRVGVIGNLVIAFLIVLVIVLAGYLYRINIPLIWTIIFAFQITFIREITKDVQDIEGDLAFKLRTLPIQIGIDQTKRVLLILYILFWISTYGPAIYSYFVEGKLLISYLLSSLLLVQVPLAVIMWHMLRSNSPEEFGKQSSYLKYIMLTGICTLFFLN